MTICWIKALNKAVGEPFPTVYSIRTTLAPMRSVSDEPRYVNDDEVPLYDVVLNELDGPKLVGIPVIPPVGLVIPPMGLLELYTGVVVGVVGVVTGVVGVVTGVVGVVTGVVGVVGGVVGVVTGVVGVVTGVVGVVGVAVLEPVG